MTNPECIFDILQQFLISDEITDSMVDHLLTEAKHTFKNSRQRKPDLESTQTSNQALDIAKKLQNHFDTNRGSLLFTNRVSRSDDEPSPFPDVSEVPPDLIIQVPFELRHRGKEVFFLIGWSACDYLIQESYAILRNRVKKNGWNSNKKRISLQHKMFSDWLEALGNSDSFGFYPYIGPFTQINWHQASTRISQALTEEIKTLEEISNGSWPNKEIFQAYSGKRKADIYFQWSILSLMRMLEVTKNDHYKELKTDLKELFAYLGVEINSSFLRVGAKQRLIDGKEVRQDPMQLWQTICRLKTLVS
ncbi:MAG: hypothetical protein HUU57_10350 [Bdellovibrio sp.]|nr:hypothetical protein [Bdellovibrio sp.]